MNDEFIKMPIYGKCSWPIEKNDKHYFINAENTKMILSFFRNGDTKLKTYCVFCKDEESFTSESKLTISRTGGGNTVIYYGNYMFFNNYKDNMILIGQNNISEIRLGTETILCNLNNNHKYEIYYKLSRDENEFSITKIGQNISPYEIGLPEAKVYEKQLKHFDAVEDYRRVFVHSINNDNIAALLYLRRVFEKMVVSMLDGAELSNNHFETKIKKLKDDNKLNPKISSLAKPVYKLLSKGIHELSNEECSTLFASLKLFVEMQLMHIKTEEENNKRLSELKKEINEKYSKFK